MEKRTNPFEELERVFERMSNQFDEISRKWESETPIGQWTTDVDVMAIDLLDQDDAYVVTVDLPGYERGDVDLKVSDSTLQIEAEREESREEGTGEYLRQERRHESLQRSIRLPDEIDPENVTAQMKNGVLTISLPKHEVHGAHTIEIE